MDAVTVPILIVDRPTKNDRIYPRDVVERAIAKLAGAPLNVVAYDDDYHASLKTIPLGQASDLKVDEQLGQVVANIKFESMPKSMLDALTYGIMGEGVVNNGTLSEFTMTGVGVCIPPSTPSCGQKDS